MVEAGADPMMIDGSGITSVHLALRLERKDIAWLLLTLWKTKRGFNDGSCPVGSNSVHCWDSCCSSLLLLHVLRRARPAFWLLSGSMTQMYV
jgi:hypothetical protein